MWGVAARKNSTPSTEMSSSYLVITSFFFGVLFSNITTINQPFSSGAQSRLVEMRRVSSKNNTLKGEG